MRGPSGGTSSCPVRFGALGAWSVALCAALMGPAAIRAAEPDPPPNIIVILTDDAGYVDFGCYGGTVIPTPQIDSLARDGVRFSNGYVTASVCCPSRAGLLTGRYQQRFGHECNGPGKVLPPYRDDQGGLAVDEQTIGTSLQALGYRTMAVGKWHMGLAPQFFPLNRGFHEFFGMKGGSRGYFPIPGKPGPGQVMWKNQEEYPEEDLRYLTDDFTDAAIDFIQRHPATPFFLYLSYNAVHTPMHAEAEDLEAFADLGDKTRRTYAAMDKALDDGVGRVLETLRDLGLEQNTLVFFINDNGGATNNGSDNGPLRGMKGSKWEGGIRVPFMVKWPARFPAGTTYEAPVSALDILATSVAAAGGDPGAHPKPLDGVNLIPFLTGTSQGEPHPQLFWRRSVAAACRQGPWKLIRTQGNPTLLFNLDQDPGETHDLADRFPDRVRALTTALETWESELAPLRWREGERWEKNQMAKHRMSVVGREQERRSP